MLLTPEERSSALWKRIAGHYEERLTVLRARNDGDQSESATQRLRGRIQEVKSILALGNEPEQIEDEPID